MFKILDGYKFRDLLVISSVFKIVNIGFTKMNGISLDTKAQSPFHIVLIHICTEYLPFSNIFTILQKKISNIRRAKKAKKERWKLPCGPSPTLHEKKNVSCTGISLYNFHELKN